MNKPHAPNRAAITAHLDMLHMHAKATGADGVLVLVGYGEKPSTGKKLPTRVKPFPIGDVTRMVDQTMEWTVLPHVNVYAAPVVMRPDLPAKCRGGKEDIVRVFALVADYDDDDAANWASRVRIAPSYVLETSPGRFQTGFLLDPLDCAQAEALAKHLQATAQCDAGTGDIAHVWRIDGTLNWPNKKKATSGRSLAPVLVRTVPGGTGAVVRDLEARLDSGQDKKSERKAEKESKPITADDETQLARMFASKHGDKIKQLWTGDYSDYPSQSEADSALCCHLAFWFGRDAERMDRLFRLSGLMREKWDSPRSDSTYGRDCITNACAVTTDTYQEAPKAVLDMNAQYAVVWLGGDCVILREHPAPDTGLMDVSFCTKGALKLFHAADPKVGKVNRVEAWLRHPAHRTYDGLVFQPGPIPCDPKLYNLWRGFAVEPKKGDCSLYLAHLKENIAGGNEEYFRYLMAWMANIVQTPGNRPGVAIVLRGKQGTGKGVFAKGFGTLFTPHFAHITNSHQLVGRFNALLKKAVVIFADEAFWAGDKQAEGTLNALITEETHNIEPKGIDPFSVKNFMHLIVASNHDWVIPAASEARRWLMLDVSERHLQDHAYFKAIDTQMKHGGSEALLYDLLAYDVSGVDLWTVPKTEALDDQKVHTMTPVEKFWFGCLQAGSQTGDRWDAVGRCTLADDKWWTWIRSTELYDRYIARSQQAGVTRRAREMELADALKRMVPGATHGRITATQPGVMAIYGVQVRGWTFPPLKECRAAFDQYMNWTYPWPDDLDDLGNEVVSSQAGS